MSELSTAIDPQFDSLKKENSHPRRRKRTKPRRNHSSMPSTPLHAAQEIRTLKERTAALGPWSHNKRLCGVQTAPDHFLGDYPQIKYDRFSDSLPRNLTGLFVLV